MKICIFGAGAIGSYLAVQLARAGHQVTAIARGEQLRAMQSHGLTLLTEGERRHAQIPASDDPAVFGPQDVVICTLKAHQASACAAQFVPLLGPQTALLTAMNGLPWWYFYKEGSRFENTHLQSVDPGARQWTLIGPQRAIGCVISAACEWVSPGVVRHQKYKRFTIGEPDGSRSSRVLALSQALNDAGLDAPVRDDIRWNIWRQLWGNVCFNPISALTHSTLDRIVGQPALRSLCKTIMQEARQVSQALGLEIPEDMIERRLNAAGAVVGHKMSMLQDLERQRSLEIDPLVTAVQELGRMTDTPTPTIDHVLALVQELGRQLGLYQPGQP